MHTARLLVVSHVSGKGGASTHPNGHSHPQRGGSTHPLDTHPNPGKEPGTRDISPPWTVTYLWKHYLSATSFSGGNNYVLVPFSVPYRNYGKVMFLHVSVILSTRGDQQTVPPRAGRQPPRRPLQRTARILLECILISSCNHKIGQNILKGHNLKMFF